MKADIINEKYYNILILTGFYYHFIFINFYFHSKDNSIYCKHLKHFPTNNLILLEACDWVFEVSWI